MDRMFLRQELIKLFKIFLHRSLKIVTAVKLKYCTQQ